LKQLITWKVIIRTPLDEWLLLIFCLSALCSVTCHRNKH